MTATRSVWEIAADIIDPPDNTGRVALPHQIAPMPPWFVWLMMGGRGAGKTDTGSDYMHKHMMGPPCLPNVIGGHWAGIIAPTLGDGVTSCVNGPSGLRTRDPKIKLRQEPGGTIVRWPNGAEAKVFGASTPEDVERLRSGGNRCFVWAEELAAWRYLEQCWQHMRYGLRVGPWPHVVITTTPKPKPLIVLLVIKAKLDVGEPLTPKERRMYERVLKEKAKEGQTDLDLDALFGRTVLTRASTKDNPHLQPHIRKMLYADYGGTREGRQELDAEILEDIEGAMWTDELISRWRLSENLAPINKEFDKVIVAVDPNVKEHKNECGIIVLGYIKNYKLPPHMYERGITETNATRPHAFVLADETIPGGPTRWGPLVARCVKTYNADYVVAEINNGGDMVAGTIHAANPNVYVKVVHASRGKRQRAEPVVRLYEQGRVHHVGYLPDLEDQLTSWDFDDPPADESPDRLDANVWGLTELLVGLPEMRKSQGRDTRLRKRR